MKREELLKLPEGIYLLTDSIVNYKYVLHRFGIDNDTMVAFLFDYHSYVNRWSPHIAIFNGLENIEIEHRYYYRNKTETIVGKRLTASAGVGGLSGHYDFWSNLNELRLVGKYDKETIAEDIKNFKRHWWINLSPRDKRERRRQLKNK